MGTFLSSLSCTKESSWEREDRLSREAAYHRIMSGYYSASTHSFDVWIDSSVRPPIIHLSIQRRPVPETTYEQLLFPNATRTRIPVVRGTRGQRAESLDTEENHAEIHAGQIPTGEHAGEAPTGNMHTEETPTENMRTVDLHMGGLHTEDIHPGFPVRRPTSMGSARSIRRILGDVRIRNGARSSLQSVQSPVRSSVRSVPMGTIVEGRTWGNHATATGREY